jgi:DnaJ-domain-containing protein 1
VRNVRLISVARGPSLAARAHDMDGFDPHTILGVPASAAFEEVKSAWHRLSKRYHPDRFANVELPEEVAEYLAVMARRVNAAYSALETAHLSRKRVAEARAAPIYSRA